MEKSSGRGSKRENSGTRVNFSSPAYAFKKRFSKGDRWKNPAGNIGKIHILVILEGIVICVALSVLFYRSAVACVFIAPLMVPYCRHREREKQETDRRKLILQFQEALESVITALRSGESPENAFRSGRKEMVFAFGEAAPICKELEIIENGLENHIPLEDLLVDMSVRTDVEEIQEFAEVFKLAKRGGGSMVNILKRTCLVIEQRIEVENEISITLGNRKLEARIMDAAPMMIIFYISITSPGLLDVLYHNLTGVIFMTVCLSIYVGAYILSERILAIKF